MRTANQSQSPTKSAEITDQKEMDQCIFTMEDFKHTCDLSDCSHMTRLQRIDQLFGFFADEPDYQKQYEHEIIAFPIRNPLINIKDAYLIPYDNYILFYTNLIYKVENFNPPKLNEILQSFFDKYFEENEKKFTIDIEKIIESMKPDEDSKPIW